MLVLWGKLGGTFHIERERERTVDEVTGESEWKGRGP